jgi:hypothetical protein
VTLIPTQVKIATQKEKSNFSVLFFKKILKHAALPADMIIRIKADSSIVSSPYLF